MSTIATPTLLIAGENDRYANRRQMMVMRSAIENSELLIINNAEHLVQHTHPHIVGPLIVDFLRRHET